MLPEGLLSFPLTAFGPDCELNLDAFSEHLEDQLAFGPAGVFVAAGAGEFTALSLEEYQSVIKRAAGIVRGRVPLFAGVGAGAAHAIANARIASEERLDGLLLLPPYLVTSPPEGLLSHVRAVADSTNLPVVVYQRANACFTPQSALRLLEIPTVVGLKDGHGDIELLQRIITSIRSSAHPRSKSFGFQNGQPTAELSAVAYSSIGVTSYSSAVLNFAPDIAKDFFRAISTGDLERVELLLKVFYLPFAELRDAVPGYAVSLIKAGARLRGHDLGSVRPPLVDAYPEHVEKLEALLASARSALRAVAA